MTATVDGLNREGETDMGDFEKGLHPLSEVVLSNEAAPIKI
jgi:hypothetical protein